MSPEIVGAESGPSLTSPLPAIPKPPPGPGSPSPACTGQEMPLYWSHSPLLPSPSSQDQQPPEGACEHPNQVPPSSACGPPGVPPLWVKAKSSRRPPRPSGPAPSPPSPPLLPLSPLLTVFHPHGPPHCSSNTPGPVLPQDLCTDSLCYCNALLVDILVPCSLPREPFPNPCI